jgi:hypothetical protein
MAGEPARRDMFDAHVSAREKDRAPRSVLNERGMERFQFEGVLKFDEGSQAKEPLRLCLPSVERVVVHRAPSVRVVHREPGPTSCNCTYPSSPERR